MLLKLTQITKGRRGAASQRRQTKSQSRLFIQTYPHPYAHRDEWRTPDPQPEPKAKPKAPKVEVDSGAECFQAIAANTFSMHTITSSKLLAKLKLNYAGAMMISRDGGGTTGG